jgi:hypothetical protein
VAGAHVPWCLWQAVPSLASCTLAAETSERDFDFRVCGSSRQGDGRPVPGRIPIGAHVQVSFGAERQRRAAAPISACGATSPLRGNALPPTRVVLLDLLVCGYVGYSIYTQWLAALHTRVCLASDSAAAPLCCRAAYKQLAISMSTERLYRLSSHLMQRSAPCCDERAASATTAASVSAASASSSSSAAAAAAAPRARDLGVPFVGQPGPTNSIVDVAGVAVGHCTIIHGEGDEAVRTGVTAVLPRGTGREGSCYAGWFSMNGCGELTGMPWVEESGIATGPYMITGTGSVGLVHDALLLWAHQRGDVGLPGGGLPIVGETYDGRLSLGRHDSVTQPVSPEHVFEALDGASNTSVPEGCVGGGTGMITHGFKGGIGSSSRCGQRLFCAILYQKI